MATDETAQTARDAAAQIIRDAQRQYDRYLEISRVGLVPMDDDHAPLAVAPQPVGLVLRTA